MILNNDCPYSLGDEGFAGHDDGTPIISVQPLAEGILFAGTGKRGGLWISKEIADQIPEPWRACFTATECDGSGVVSFELPRQLRPKPPANLRLVKGGSQKEASDSRAGR